jgi:hypothetical protein
MTVYHKLFLATAAAAVMLVFLSPGKAEANGQVRRFVDQDAGPYVISLGTLPQTPVLGRLHMTMTVVERSSGVFITDAQVTVTGMGPGEEAVEMGPLVASNNSSDPTFYDISTTVDREGTWVFTVGVTSDLGQAATEFAIEVTKASTFMGMVTILALLAFLTVLGLSVRVFLRQQARGGGGRSKGS